MPPSRSTHDPFTTSSSNASTLRSQQSQTSLRSTHAGTATARTRQPANLFAPSLLRRSTSRTTPRLEEDVVLPDSDSEADMSLLGQTRQARQQQTRRLRHGSPDTSRQARLRPRQQAEEQDMVNRQPDGSYLLGASTLGIAAPRSVFGHTTQDGDDAPEQEEIYHRELARKYFTTGVHVGGRHNRAAEDEYEQEKPKLMANLRKQVMGKLEGERWLYEASDRFHPAMT